MNSKTALRRLVEAFDKADMLAVHAAVVDARGVLTNGATVAPTAEPRPVIICTDKRGVFFGYATKTDGDPVTISKARMCVYWSADVKGITGLAANGPTKSCKIGPPAPALELRGITCVMDVTAAAAKLWESAPWQS